MALAPNAQTRRRVGTREANTHGLSGRCFHDAPMLARPCHRRPAGHLSSLGGPAGVPSPPNTHTLSLSTTQYP
jgi:hypothetical protein